MANGNIGKTSCHHFWCTQTLFLLILGGAHAPGASPCLRHCFPFLHFQSLQPNPANVASAIFKHAFAWVPRSCHASVCPFNRSFFIWFCSNSIVGSFKKYLELYARTEDPVCFLSPRPRAGVEFWGWGSKPPPHQLSSLRSAVNYSGV